MASFDPARDIPNLNGKVILITGGTAGLGLESLLTIAAHGPSKLFFTGRNVEAAEKTIAQLKETAPSVAVKFLRCDHASLASVQQAARTVLAETDRLDVVFCVAGVMALPPGLTEDGYELQFGVNHLSHALLLKLLLPLLQRTAKDTANAGTTSAVRIVIYASLGMAFARSLPLNLMKTPLSTWPLGPWQRYGYSKLSNILYAQQLALHYPEILTGSIQPGVIDTGLVSNISWANRAFVYATTVGQMVSVEEGARNGLWVAFGQGEGAEEMRNGGFWEPVGKKGMETAMNTSEEAGRELWEWTQKELEGWN